MKIVIMETPLLKMDVLIHVKFKKVGNVQEVQNLLFQYVILYAEIK